MKLFIVALAALGIVLLIWGSSITQGEGSADERIAGAYPILAGIGFIALSIVIAFVWLLLRA